MELKAGYKQTEVGVIPKDWELARLGTVANFRTGPFGSALHKSDYVYGGIPVINPMQIIDGKIVNTPRMAISETAAQKLSEFRLFEHDIVIGRRGEMGRCAVVQFNQSGWLCGTGSMIVRPDARLESRFAQRILSSPPVIAAIEATSVGTTMINLNQGTLSNLQIPIPPTYAEQQAIAETLSDADALIDSVEQLLTKKRQIKQGAMQELLTGQRRLPGFSGAWDVRSLGSICDISMGRTPSRLNAAFWGAGYVWLSISDLKSKVVSTSKEEVTPLAAAAMRSIRKGTLLMSFKLSIGRLCFAGCDLFTNEAICSFNNPRANTDFLYYMLGRTDFSLYGKQAVKGFTLNKESLNSVEVPYPSLEEQTAIASILSAMDDEISTLEIQLQKARQLKQGMTQELLAGRIRLV
jgi:type I restriction enzyme S subunit